jgi:hypothetical protein
MKFTQIKYESHSRKFWQNPNNFSFASKDATVPLGASEMLRAMTRLAIGLVLDNEEYFPVAIVGLGGNQNLLVEKDGRWLEEYLPAIYGCYPFRLLPADDNRFYLCVDEESGLVNDQGKGHPIYTEQRGVGWAASCHCGSPG